MTLRDEVIDDTQPYTLFDPEHIWKRKRSTITGPSLYSSSPFPKRRMRIPIPSIEDIAPYCQEQIDTMWDEVLRFENPHRYYVDLSQALWDERERLLSEYSL